METQSTLMPPTLAGTVPRRKFLSLKLETPSSFSLWRISCKKMK